MAVLPRLGEEMALLDWPMLRKGAREHPVPSLQYHLRARGHLLTLDGWFGPETDAAVRAYQKKAHLAVNGVVAFETWSALLVVVGPGDDGDAVRSVQEEFQFRNMSGDPAGAPVVDGMFGPRTEAAVRSWQQFVRDYDDSAMAVDGVVDRMTWQSLLSGMYSG
jgi:peptidoglycan hydrolase-like protein with peptidoglycan-binding domain